MDDILITESISIEAFLRNCESSKIVIRSKTTTCFVKIDKLTGSLLEELDRVRQISSKIEESAIKHISGIDLFLVLPMADLFPAQDFSFKPPRFDDPGEILGKRKRSKNK